MLKVNGVDVFYGKVQALFDVSIEIGEKEIVSIIGANGAGKTTLMKTIMGINKPRKGNVFFKEEDITPLKTHKIVDKHIVYVPEGREIFPAMSVYDNLIMGAYSQKYNKGEMASHLQQMYNLFPRLEERNKQMAGSLSGGEQQMLAIARGLMSDPELVMFDEPSLGLAPVIVDEMFDIIVNVNKELHIPIIIVEQNAFMAMSVSDRRYVLEVGRIASEGESKALMDSPDIKRAYLGD